MFMKTVRYSFFHHLYVVAAAMCEEEVAALPRGEAPWPHWS